MANVQRIHVQRIIQGIEELLNKEIPGTPQLKMTTRGGRVMYVALPGSGRKSKNVLSRRAQQVLGAINRQRRATAGALQKTLDVNRNVIAGAVHELKRQHFIQAVPAGVPFEAAAGAPRHRSDDRPTRRRSKKAAKTSK